MALGREEIGGEKEDRCDLLGQEPFATRCPQREGGRSPVVCFNTVSRKCDPFSTARIRGLSSNPVKRNPSRAWARYSARGVICESG